MDNQKRISSLLEVGAPNKKKNNLTTSCNVEVELKERESIHKPYQTVCVFLPFFPLMNSRVTVGVGSKGGLRAAGQRAIRR